MPPKLTPLAERLHESDLPPEIEQACDLVDRLEMYRQCLDEAIADAYTELAAALGRHMPDHPDLHQLLELHRIGKPAPSSDSRSDSRVLTCQGARRGGAHGDQGTLRGGFLAGGEDEVVCDVQGNRSEAGALQTGEEGGGLDGVVGVALVELVQAVAGQAV
jgi:hypothetical protein